MSTAVEEDGLSVILFELHVSGIIPIIKYMRRDPPPDSRHASGLMVSLPCKMRTALHSLWNRRLQKMVGR